MSDWPYHTASSFVRDPQRYAHDAFGHVGADDKIVRPKDVCFRKIPHTGIDISSKEPRWKNGLDNRAAQMRTPVVSPIHGTIVKAGFDPEAGNYHIIKHRDYNEWWIGGHHSKFAKSSGTVERGELIAMMGDTGGAQGVHTHWTVVTSLAAALAYIGGWVQYRNNKSVNGWAALAIRGKDQRMYGLVDPWPLIQREWADEEQRRKADQTPAKESVDNDEEELMALSKETQDTLRDIIQQEVSKEARIIESRLKREIRPEAYFISHGADGTEYSWETSPYAILLKPDGTFMMPLNIGGHVGQHDSLKRNYRIINQDSVPQGFPERVFWNTIKDIARGAGIIDRNISEADGVAWAKSLFGI